MNHSKEFVTSETGDDTQSIESTWTAVKRSLPRSGTQKDFYKSYLLSFFFDGNILKVVSSLFRQGSICL